MFSFFLLIYVLSTCGCYKYIIFNNNAVNSDLKYLFFSKRPTRYTAKYDTLDKPHELGVMGVEKKTWFFEMSVTAVWLWDEVSAVNNCFALKWSQWSFLSQYITCIRYIVWWPVHIYNTCQPCLCIQHIDVAFYYLRKKIRENPNLQERKVTTVDSYFSSMIATMSAVYVESPDTFDWGTCDRLLKIMFGMSIPCGMSWFDSNTILLPVHLDKMEHWVLVKLDLTDWTMEVYDSMHHAGPHNEKVRHGVECLSVLIPLLAGQIGLFDSKPREPPGMHPIPVTIVADIPKQANG